jgi:hypothetical protein
LLPEERDELIRAQLLSEREERVKADGADEPSASSKVSAPTARAAWRECDARFMVQD